MLSDVTTIPEHVESYVDPSRKLGSLRNLNGSCKTGITIFDGDRNYYLFSMGIEDALGMDI